MSHGPPDLPIHLVPPLGGLLSTRGGHGKGLQPCFTIRDNLTDRTARDRDRSGALGTDGGTFGRSFLGGYLATRAVEPI